MSFGGEVEFPWLSPFSHFNVSTLIFSNRNARVRNIWNLEKEVLKTSLDFFLFIFNLFHLLRDDFPFFYQLFSVFILSFFLQFRYGLGYFVSFETKLILLGYEPSPLFIFFQYPVDYLNGVTSLLQSFLHLFRIVSYDPYIQHQDTPFLSSIISTKKKKAPMRGLMMLSVRSYHRIFP